MRYLQSMAALNSILFAVALVGWIVSYDLGASLTMNVFIGGLIFSSINLLSALCMTITDE